MTQAATQITLSLADHVRGWSRQERDLAMAIRGLQVASCPSPATSLVPPQHFAPLRAAALTTRGRSALLDWG